MRVEITTVDGEQAKALALQQARAIQALLEWAAARQSEGDNTEDTIA